LYNKELVFKTTKEKRVAELAVAKELAFQNDQKKNVR
jgi:hypothetical protein